MKIQDITFSLSRDSRNIKDFIILQGIIVPMGSVVEQGLADVQLPSLEDCSKSFKLLFGIRKKIRVIEEEEPVILESEEEEDSIDEEEEQTEEEEEEDDE